MACKQWYHRFRTKREAENNDEKLPWAENNGRKEECDLPTETL